MVNRMRFLVWICMLGTIHLSAQVQFKNILLDNSPNETGRFPSEPSISISYKNRDVIVAGSVINNVYYSANGGATWTKSTLESEYGVWGDPVIISDFSGNFYYFHLSDPTGKNWASDEVLDRIVVQRSKDGGVSWSKGESIGHNPPKDQDKPWATTDRKGKVYVTWTQFDKYGSDNPECKSVILFSQSSNGSKWSKPVQLSQFPGNCLDDDNTTQGAVPAVTNDGKIFVAWSNEGVIFLDRSFNGGNTWLTNDIAVVEQVGGWNMVIPGINRANGMPVLRTDNSKGNFSGALYLVWADQRNGEHDTDIWFIRSYNFGDNWTQPMRINNDEPGKHQFSPWMSVDPETGYIYIVYYDRSAYDDEQTDVYLAWSTDNGSTFKNSKISNEPFKPQPDVFFGDYLNVSAYAGRIAVVWTRMDEGKTSIWSSVFNHEVLDGTKPAIKKDKKESKKKGKD